MKNSPGIKFDAVTGTLLLSISMLAYIIFGVFSELTGDYLVYWDMYLNGSMESFKNQPVFTLYYEILRNIIPIPEIFFVVVLLPWLLVVSNYYFKNIFMRRPLVFSLLLIFFCSLILQPTMLFFLLRQNLAILIFLALLPLNIFIASILAIGFHYSFAPIIIIAYMLSVIAGSLTRVIARLFFYLFSMIMIFILSSKISNIFLNLDTNNIEIIDHYINLYKQYDDIFPSFIGLRIFVFFGSLIYVLYLNRMNFVYKWVGAITTSIFFISIALSFSDPLSYRFLQMAKIPCFILMLWYLCEKSFDKDRPKYFLVGV